jgi:hypothetical protein
MAAKNARRPIRRLCIVVLAAAAIYRLTLVNQGALAFVDETWYFKTVMTLQSLTAGDGRGALGHIAATLGRPGATLIRLPVAALQAIPLAFGVAPSNPRSLLIPQVANVFLSLGMLYLFFDIGLIVCGDASSALVAAIVYATLVNTNLYIRHVLPYDWALCVGLCAVWLSVRRPLTSRRTCVIGLLAGIMITIYPGYYLLVPLLGILIVGQTWRDGRTRAIHLAALFSIAVGIVVAATMLLCRAGGISYIASLQEVNRLQEMGRMDERWTFVPEYLIRVERFSGLALLVGALVTAWRTASRIRRGEMRPIDWLLVATLAAWAWQCTSFMPGHRTLLGRLIHPWMLFLGWALAEAMASVERAALRALVFSAALGAALISWVPSALAYSELAYPSDVLYALGIDTTRLPSDRMHCEFTGPQSSFSASPGPLDRRTRYPYTSDTNLWLLNFCHAENMSQAPKPSWRERAPAGAVSELFDGPHWLTYPAYEYEGLAPVARHAVANGNYRIRVYRLSTSRQD